MSTAYDIIHARCGSPGADETITSLKSDLDAMRRGRAASDQHLRSAIDERDKLLERVERMAEEIRTLRTRLEYRENDLVAAMKVNVEIKRELEAAQSEIQASIEKRAKRAKKR